MQLDLAKVVPAGPEEELAQELQDLEKYVDFGAQSNTAADYRLISLHRL